MKRLSIFILIAALTLMAVPVGALAPGIPLITSAVQAEILPAIAVQSVLTEALTAPFDLALYGIKGSARKGSARKGSDDEGGEPPEGDPSGAVATASKKDSRFLVPDGKVRRFECMTPCYWDQTRYRDADELGKGTGDIVEFQGPTEIPKDFQFDNWREI